MTVLKPKIIFEEKSEIKTKKIFLRKNLKNEESPILLK